jgi:hypothetical protein
MNNPQNPPALPSLLTTPRRSVRRVTDADVAKLPPDADFSVDGVDMGAFTLRRYVYLGDKHTDEKLTGMCCDPVRRPDTKCVVNVGMASALVVDDTGMLHVVARRRLRLVGKLKMQAGVKL